jgi:transposase-like protein
MKMSKREVLRNRARYTAEFKQEAVRLVKAGQDVSGTANALGIPKQTLSVWVTQATHGVLPGAGNRVVSAEQMELTRLRAELARVKMERDILKKATAYFAKDAM